jgi:hypothetical protein
MMFRSSTMKMREDESWRLEVVIYVKIPKIYVKRWIDCTNNACNLRSGIAANHENYTRARTTLSR